MQIKCLEVIKNWKRLDDENETKQVCLKLINNWKWLEDNTLFCFILSFILSAVLNSC